MKEKLGGMALVQGNVSELFLEYYLSENDTHNYAVKIEKKEMKNGNFVLREDYTSEYMIDGEDTANKVLELLVKNSVTPTTADCVLEDLGYFD